MVIIEMMWKDEDINYIKTFIFSGKILPVQLSVYIRNIYILYISSALLSIIIFLLFSRFGCFFIFRTTYSFHNGIYLWNTGYVSYFNNISFLIYDFMCWVLCVLSCLLSVQWAVSVEFGLRNEMQMNWN